jgi:hypothetical protein
VPTSVTPDFERLCEEEFRVAADAVYKNLDLEVAGIKAHFGSMGHTLSTDLGETVKQAVLQRFDKVVKAFDHVFLDKWRDDSKRPFTEEDKRWLDEQVTKQFEPRTLEAWSKCSGYLWEQTRFLARYWDETGIEARQRLTQVRKSIEILQLEKRVLYSNPTDVKSPPTGNLTPLSDAEQQAFFATGSDHDAYIHIRAILQTAKANLFIIDPYMDGTIYQVLGTLISAKMTVKILTSKVSSDFVLEGRKFVKQHTQFCLEFRRTKDFHDRFIILDQTKCYLIGASIKDAGNKGFAIVELEDSRSCHQTRNGGLGIGHPPLASRLRWSNPL